MDVAVVAELDRISCGDGIINEETDDISFRKLDEEMLLDAEAIFRWECDRKEFVALLLFDWEP